MKLVATAEPNESLNRVSPGLAEEKPQTRAQKDSKALLTGERRNV